MPYSPAGDRLDIPIPAFAHNCPIPNYGLDELTLRKAVQAYYACVSFVDAQVGRLMEALERLQIEDETIVITWVNMEESGRNEPSLKNQPRPP